MRRVALLVLLLPLAGDALAARRPPKAPPPEAAPVVEAAPPTLAALGAAGPPVAAPRLEGSASTLDITTMQRTVLVFDLALPDLGLARASEAERTALRRTLAADPRWRVGGRPGEAVATWRASGVSTPSGYVEERGTLWRATVRFGRWPAGDPWAISPLVTRVGADARSVKLAPVVMQEAPWAGRRVTAVSVDGGALGYDVFEAGSGDARAVTPRAVEAIGELVSRAWVTADFVIERGADGMLLPPGEPAAPAAVALGSPGAGLLRLTARANPGEDGWTWLRLLVDGAPWEEAAVTAGTREMIGYSGHPEQGFYMESTFQVPPGPARAAVAELWFSAGQGAPRRLSRSELVIPAR